MHVGEEFIRARQIVNLALNPHAYISYSQFGEDLLIDVLFYGKTDSGFYVDVGAHHPLRLSNTYLLNLKGWRGINIEGDPQLIAAFNAERPNDINVNAFISDSEGIATFNRFSDTAVNTISDEKAENYRNHWTVISSQDIKTRTLRSVLDQHLPPNQSIDLLSVDVEGLDLRVLKGNDWSKYRPTQVIVEIDELDLQNAGSHPAVQYMSSNGYRLSNFVHVSAFFTKI